MSVSLRELGRTWRTLVHLHPLQVGARAPSIVWRRVLARIGVPSASPPTLVVPTVGRDKLAALQTFAAAERARFLDRQAWLAGSPRLEAYERRYGLDLGAAGDGPSARRWDDATSFEPYVASVRARRLATAISAGRQELFPDLVRAARAVLLQPELHLLGNHLLENGIGLIAASAVAAGPEADLWWQVGAGILEWQLALQFYGDGMHDEGSMTYHLALVAGLVEAVLLADAAGREVPARWCELLERAVGVARDYESPDGRYPLFNDAAYDAGPSVQTVIELADAAGLYVRAPRAAAVLTSDVGWVRLRNRRAFCVMKAGPDGSPTQPGHVHADMLSVELWVDGRKVICDPGVASYNDDEARAWCRSSAAHNGPSLAGIDSSEVWSAFRTGRRCRATVESLGRDERTASARAFWRLGNGPRMERDVALHGDHLLLRDRATHTRSERLRARFETPRVRQWTDEAGVLFSKVDFGEHGVELGER